MNTFGDLFRLTTFGESHGPAVGCVIDGCPAGVRFDTEMLQRNLSRRRPGQALTTSRDEPDEAVVLSGLFEGMTTGTPICIMVYNRDQRSGDYDSLKELYRPSHADFTYAQKYGHRDHRGGGRSSARETLARVIGGSVARMMLQQKTEVSVTAAVTTLGPYSSVRNVGQMSEERVYASDVRSDDPERERQFRQYLMELKEIGDSTGGIVSVVATNVPSGLGEPIYSKLSSRLAGAMMSINGSTGFEIGAGFGASAARGSTNNDQWIEDGEGLKTSSNNSGGIQGGISNGMPVEFRVAFKPPSSIRLEQKHGTATGDVVDHTVSGRHDPSIVVRAVPVVEAMTWLVIADLWLRNRSSASFVE